MMEVESDGVQIRSPSSDEFSFSVDGAERPKASHGRSLKEPDTTEQIEPIIQVPSGDDQEPDRLILSPLVASPILADSAENEPEDKPEVHESRSSSRTSAHVPAIEAQPPEAIAIESRRPSSDLPVMLQAIRNSSSEGCDLLRRGKAHEASHKFQHAYKYAVRY